MAVTAQEQLPSDVPRPTPTAKRTTSVWTRTSQLRQAEPMIRLLTQIWAVPQVVKLGVHVDGSGTYVHALLEDDDRNAEDRIIDAESEYLRATPLHNFDLHVSPLSALPDGVRDTLLIGFETVLER